MRAKSFVRTSIILSFAFVSQSLIPHVLISGEMHASFARRVPASARITGRFIDNALQSISLPIFNIAHICATSAN